MQLAERGGRGGGRDLGTKAARSAVTALGALRRTRTLARNATKTPHPSLTNHRQTLGAPKYLSTTEVNEISLIVIPHSQARDAVLTMSNKYKIYGCTLSLL